MEEGVPRRPGDTTNTPRHGTSAKATPVQGTPIHPGRSPQPAPQRPSPTAAPIPPGAPTRPIVRAPSPQPIPNAPTPHPPPSRTEPEHRPDAAWAAAPEVQDAYIGQDEPSSTTGAMGARETSGVQV
ncbi:MAG: hypothetical protein ACRDNL_18075, partial [Spirillospora sp.]